VIFTACPNFIATVLSPPPAVTAVGVVTLFASSYSYAFISKINSVVITSY
jgi:hypothetical protein